MKGEIVLKKMVIIISLLLLTACGSAQISTTEVHGVNTEDAQLNQAVIHYFVNIDDIYQWSAYATDDYIKRVYYWCSGDHSETKSFEEMKIIYTDINKNSLKLKNYEVISYEKPDENTVHLNVKRYWERGVNDETTYTFIKVDGDWKVDNRI